MPSSLIPIHQLIGDSWRSFLAHWNETFQIAVWLLLAPLLMCLAALVSKNSTAPAFEFLSSLLMVLYGVLTVWVTIRLLRWLLNQKQTKNPWSLFWPFVWISLLQGLATLGGVLFFVLPGVWLTVRLNFARLILLDQNTRGIAALETSANLVKGRWWATFWRLLLPGLFFTILMAAALSILSAFFTAMSGFAKVSLVFRFASGPETVTPLTLALWYLIQAIIQTLFLPLLMVWQVKLYQALKLNR